jgi:dimethylhistidine N-methyltransferase
MTKSQAGEGRELADEGMDAAVRSFADEVSRGLGAALKSLPCLYFYDYRGSQLFEEICGLPEYYLTDAEAEILKASARDIVSRIPAGCLLVELGSGSCTKTRYIIEEMLGRHDGLTFSPIDISRKMLRESAISLSETYRDLEVIPVAAEYSDGLRRLDSRVRQPKLIMWLGSSIGNFEFEEAVGFLRDIVEALSPEDHLLIGFDLEKDGAVLEKAYNDSRGVTADFNLNLLRRINRELGGEFDLGRFEHEAVYDEKRKRIEMYLVSGCDQAVHIAALGRSYRFARGERIHTESSHKFSPDAIETLAARTGMRIVEHWTDARDYFNLTLFMIEAGG